VQKHGKDKGVMRLAHSKRCHKGQKSLTLNKRGPAGAPGQQGPQGPAGQGADPDALAALQQEVAALQSQLSQVQSQLSAACAQLTTVTAQLNALGTALDGIGLGGTIPALLTLVNPGAPPGLPAFSCS
jgi:Tfp pilus assembly protein FimV